MLRLHQDLPKWTEWLGQAIREAKTPGSVFLVAVGKAESATGLPIAIIIGYSSRKQLWPLTVMMAKYQLAPFAQWPVNLHQLFVTCSSSFNHLVKHRAFDWQTDTTGVWCIIFSYHRYFLFFHFSRQDVDWFFQPKIAIMSLVIQLICQPRMHAKSREMSRTFLLELSLFCDNFRVCMWLHFIAVGLKCWVEPGVPREVSLVANPIWLHTGHSAWQRWQSSVWIWH